MTFSFRAEDPDKINEMDDIRIKKIKPVIPPAILYEDISLTPAALETVKKARAEAEKIVKMEDDRLLCIVGPCSIHDVKATPFL
jgi:3-deoxy-7-phosphoheptulonate synthase